MSPNSKQTSRLRLEPALEPLTVTVEEAGRALGIGRNAAYDAVKRGEIPSLKLGRRVVVPIAGLERLVSGEAK